MIPRIFLCFSGDRSGAAAVEMALVVPLLLALITGSTEVGNYFMDSHILAKGVRDGARWAARQNFGQYNGCNGAAANVPTTQLLTISNSPLTQMTLTDATKLIVRKGSLSSTDSDLLPYWDDANTSFSVTMVCTSDPGSTGNPMGGIYIGNGTGTPNADPAVSVTATLPYRPFLSSFGFKGTGLSITATQQAAVTGI